MTAPILPLRVTRWPTSCSYSASICGTTERCCGGCAEASALATGKLTPERSGVLGVETGSVKLDDSGTCTCLASAWLVAEPVPVLGCLALVRFLVAESVELDDPGTCVCLASTWLVAASVLVRACLTLVRTCGVVDITAVDLDGSDKCTRPVSGSGRMDSSISGPIGSCICIASVVHRSSSNMASGGGGEAS